MDVGGKFVGVFCLLLLVQIAELTNPFKVSGLNSGPKFMGSYHINVVDSNMNLISDNVVGALVKSVNHQYNFGYSDTALPVYDRVLTQHPQLASSPQKVYLKLFKNVRGVQPYYMELETNVLSNYTCMLTGHLLNSESHLPSEKVPISKTFVNYNVCQKFGFFIINGEYRYFLVRRNPAEVVMYKYKKYLKNIHHSLSLLPTFDDNFPTDSTDWTPGSDTLTLTPEVWVDPELWLTFSNERKNNLLGLDYVMNKEAGRHKFLFDKTIITKMFEDSVAPNKFNATIQRIQRVFNYPQKYSYTVKIGVVVSAEVIRKHSTIGIDSWINYLVYETNRLFQHIQLKRKGLDIKISLEKIMKLDLAQSKNVHRVAVNSGLEAVMSHLQLEAQAEIDELDIVILLANENYVMKKMNFKRFVCEEETPIYSVQDSGSSTILRLTQSIAFALHVVPVEFTTCKFRQHDFVTSILKLPRLNSLHWSKCSIASLEKSSRLTCLVNKQVKPLGQFEAYPGKFFSHNAQCFRLWGNGAVIAPQMLTNICGKLWCMKPITFISQEAVFSEGSVVLSGTKCGPNSFCIRGRCLAGMQNFLQQNKVNGNWGSWSTLSDCSSKCGPGVQSRFRKCDSPSPLDGGSDCKGNSSEVTPCFVKCDGSSENIVTPYYRKQRCNELSLLPAYQTNENKACLMFCKTSQCDDPFLLPEFVEDGQPCFIGQTSGTCYQGKCYHTVCSHGDQFVKKDVCGVCGGDGSSCTFHSEVYQLDIPNDRVLLRRNFEIPEGAKGLVITELPNSTPKAIHLTIGSAGVYENIETDTCQETGYVTVEYDGVVYEIKGKTHKTISVKGPLPNGVIISASQKAIGTCFLQISYYD